MPKSLTFLGNESREPRWELPTFQVVINVLNNAVLQEILKVPGVELVDLNRIATNRPPIVDATVETPSKRVKPKGNSKPTPYADRFKHPSGKPAHYFLTEFMAKNGGKAGLAELKRHLKTLGFVPSTAMGAMTKMVDKGEVISKKPNGYVLTEKGKEVASRLEPVSG
jgi:hypothetical protein